jgi:hypothetical protein
MDRFCWRNHDSLSLGLKFEKVVAHEVRVDREALSSVLIESSREVLRLLDLVGWHKWRSPALLYPIVCKFADYSDFPRRVRRLCLSRCRGETCDGFGPIVFGG